MRGAEMRTEQQLELAMFTAWNTARISHYSGGKLPSLAGELRKLRPQAPSRPQSSEEKIAALRAIMATMGGKMETRG